VWPRRKLAEPLCQRFCAALRSAPRSGGLEVQVAQGIFGANMALELVNDGPVTIVLWLDQ
jgi:D-tyrosyl-tRNA(Tyr) deacylase